MLRNLFGKKNAANEHKPVISAPEPQLLIRFNKQQAIEAAQWWLRILKFEVPQIIAQQLRQPMVKALELSAQQEITFTTTLTNLIWEECQRDHIPFNDGVTINVGYHGQLVQEAMRQASIPTHNDQITIPGHHGKMHAGLAAYLCSNGYVTYENKFTRDLSGDSLGSIIYRSGNQPYQYHYRHKKSIIYSGDGDFIHDDLRPGERFVMVGSGRVVIIGRIPADAEIIVENGTVVVAGKVDSNATFMVNYTGKLSFLNKHDIAGMSYINYSYSAFATVDQAGKDCTHYSPWVSRIANKPGLIASSPAPSSSYAAVQALLPNVRPATRSSVSEQAELDESKSIAILLASATPINAPDKNQQQRSQPFPLTSASYTNQQTPNVRTGF